MIHEFVRMCESMGMAQTVCVLPPAEDRERLLAVVADRNRPLKHVQRARIVLCSADRLPVQEVARRASRQPTRGLALASAIRRAGCRRPAARQDAQAWPRSAFATSTPTTAIVGPSNGPL